MDRMHYYLAGYLHQSFSMEDIGNIFSGLNFVTNSKSMNFLRMQRQKNDQKRMIRDTFIEKFIKN